ncbi:MAG: glycosyltransferase [Planctomycetia bacterium]|nr:glycosyltransferase [Planctomycetia bacterium]
MKTVGIYQSGRLGQNSSDNSYSMAKIAEILSENCRVEIVHHEENLDAEAWQKWLGVNLSRVDFRYVPALEMEQGSANFRKSLREEADFGREISEPYEIFWGFGNCPPIFCHSKMGIYWTEFPSMSFDEFYGHDLPEWGQMGYLSRFFGVRRHRVSWRGRLASYQHILCPSRFTKQWCWRKWQVTPTVFPQVLRPGFTVGEKTHSIMTYGEFSAEKHERQEVLIGIFQDFYEQKIAKLGLDSEWKLIVAGTCGESEADMAFVEKLRRKAYGYPIEFLVNPGLETVQKLLGEATFFWSALGYESSEELYPERMDACGMRVLEAQAAGAIPMVYQAGAMPEVVRHAMNGLLWCTARELVDMFCAVLLENRLLPIIATGAVKNAEIYQDTAFRQNLRNRLRGMVEISDVPGTEEGEKSE